MARKKTTIGQKIEAADGGLGTEVEITFGASVDSVDLNNTVTDPVTATLSAQAFPAVSFRTKGSTHIFSNSLSSAES